MRYVQRCLIGSAIPADYFPKRVYLPVEAFSVEYPRIPGKVSAFFPREGRGEVLASQIVTVDGVTDSPTALARRIVRAHRGRYPSAEYSTEVYTFTPPIFALPVSSHWGEMIDLTRAYESILRAFGVRDILPRQYFSHTPAWEIPPRFWDGPGEKSVIRFLPTSAATTKIRIELSPGRTKFFSHLPLDGRPWATVTTFLSAIAQHALNCNARYIYVDSYIFPGGAPAEFTDFLDRLRLPYRFVAAGPVIVRGPGAYLVGKKISGHFLRVSPSPQPAEDWWKWALDNISGVRG